MKAAAANQQLSLLDNEQDTPGRAVLPQDSQNAPAADNPADTRKTAENAPATWSNSLAYLFSWGHA